MSSETGRVEVIAERQDYLLFDRMIAFHIQRGVTIPLSAAASTQASASDSPSATGCSSPSSRPPNTTSAGSRPGRRAALGLRRRREERDRLAAGRAGREPQTFQDLQPKFLRELQQNRYEALPELRDILEQNFLEDPATHRWRVPDPGKQADLEALRQRALLGEFATYRPAPASSSGSGSRRSGPASPTCGPSATTARSSRLQSVSLTRSSRRIRRCYVLRQRVTREGQ